MTAAELTEIEAGNHWLCRLSDELNVNAKRVIDELEAKDWEAGDVALAIVESSQALGVTAESKIHVRCYPWEKSRIIRAARGEKLTDWIRKALLMAAMKE